jgi:hypothetical protein
MKKCTKCHTIKELDQFFARKSSKDGKTPMCKACYIVARRDYYARNKAKVLAINKKSNHKYAPERTASVVEWQAANKDKVLGYKRKNNNEQRKKASRKLSDAISRHVNHSLHGLKGYRHWEKLTGYTTEQLREHLEGQFYDGMSWDNYGSWHVDHKIPVSVFNFTTAEDIDFKRCWDLKNLRPMWAHDNLVKWAKIDRPFQPSLAIAV